MMNEICGNIKIEDRSRVEFTGVLAVDSFDEYGITLSVSCGSLCLEGERINITVLDLEKGIVEARGLITGVYYSDNDNKPQKKGGLSRLFKGNN